MHVARSRVGGSGPQGLVCPLPCHLCWSSEHGQISPGTGRKHQCCVSRQQVKRINVKYVLKKKYSPFVKMSINGDITMSIKDYGDNPV